MPIDLNDMPEQVRQFALFQRNVLGRSAKTVEEYCVDLRTFFRYIKQKKELVPADMPFEEIPIQDVSLEQIRAITRIDIYEYMNYLADVRLNNTATRSRKAVCLRVFFKYLFLHEKLLEENPAENLPLPKTAKTLPHYLSLEQSKELLAGISGTHKSRDYCIITLFLNCGMRLSELVGLNLSDIHDDGTLRLLGKGNKERQVYLNDACLQAIKAYLKDRPKDNLKDRYALFISNQRKRISPKTVQAMVKKFLGTVQVNTGMPEQDALGLNQPGYSVHKLRHTAATLMYQYGNVDIRVLQDILGHVNLGTTQIYTHISDKQKEQAAQSNPLSTLNAPPKKKKDDT